MGNQTGGRAMTAFRHVAVLLGGLSAEREVSLVSGRACADALRAEGFETSEIDPRSDVCEALARVRPDARVQRACMAAGARTAAYRDCSN